MSKPLDATSPEGQKGKIDIRPDGGFFYAVSGLPKEVRPANPADYVAVLQSDYQALVEDREYLEYLIFYLTTLSILRCDERTRAEERLIALGEAIVTARKEPR